jgi:RNA polymerase sigma factor (sigma-70 family)
MPRSNTNHLGERILAKEEDAFLEFQYTYMRLFVTHFRRLGLTSTEAEDLTFNLLTDIPLAAIESWDPPKGNFDPWVLTCMRNAGVDWLRRRKDQVPIIDESEICNPSPVPPDAKRIADLYAKLEQLRPSDRLILELRYLRSESTFKEIAEDLTQECGNEKPICANTVRVRHLRALNRLRALYGIPKTK